MAPTLTASSGRTYPSHYADVHALVYRDGNLLMSLRRDQPVYPRVFQVPAGLMERGESATVAACRELREETGLIADPADLRLVHLMHHVSPYGSNARLAMFFEAGRWGGDLVNAEPEKCAGWDWHKIDAVPEPLPAYLRTALRNIRQGIPYSEFAWESLPATARTTDG
nr:NUDIX domain-containing protein [Streptomyces sp. NBC_00974]